MTFHHLMNWYVIHKFFYHLDYNSTTKGVLREYDLEDMICVRMYFTNVKTFSNAPLLHYCFLKTVF